MSSPQPQPTLTGNESELRRKEDVRKKRQRYDGILATLETYHSKLMQFLLMKGDKSSFPETDPLSKISLDPSPQQEVIAERALRAMADVETVIELAAISPLETVSAQPILPITETVIIDGPTLNQTQGQTSKGTTALEHLIFTGRETISNHYHAQSPKRMPIYIWMGTLNYLALMAHSPSGFFPESKVRIGYDPKLGDQIICE